MTELPRKAAARTARLASLPLGYAGRSALGVGKRLGGANAEAVLTEVQQRTAEQLFKTLGELKGGAMKFGQALSIMEAALPEELAAPYRQHLTMLQDSAPPMSATTVHHVLSAELGPKWRRELVEFDDNPAAAASIGQVHRGRWADGTEVAVKVQYPGAEDALRSDLRQIGRIAKTLGRLVPGIDVRALVEEMQARVVEELDYRLEGESQQAFAVAFADDPAYVVPAVLYAGDHVLVTAWLDSPASLARLIAEGSQEDRDHYGERYARFLFEGPARTGLMHADPHPGNFRLLPDQGRALGVLDFGAVARLPERGFPRQVGSLLRMALEDGYDDLVDRFREEGFVKPNIRIDPEELRAYLDPFIEPGRPETYKFSRQFMRDQFKRLQDPSHPGNTMMLRLNLPPEYLLMHRTWLGCAGVLCQLGAEVPFRAILADTLPGFAD